MLGNQPTNQPVKIIQVHAQTGCIRPSPNVSSQFATGCGSCGLDIDSGANSGPSDGPLWLVARGSRKATSNQPVEITRVHPVDSLKPIYNSGSRAIRVKFSKPERENKSTNANRVGRHRHELRRLYASYRVPTILPACVCVCVCVYVFLFSVCPFCLRILSSVALS